MYSQISSAFFGHTSDASKFGTIVYNGCIARGCGKAFSGYNTDRIDVVGCDVDDCGVVFNVYVPLFVVTGGEIVLANTGGTMRGVSCEVVCEAVLDGLAVTVEVNSSFVYSVDAGTVVTIQNCTIGTNGSYGVYLMADACNLTFNNNVIGNKTYYFRLGTNYVLSADYNTYGAAGSFYLDGVVYNWANYRIATGQDAHSTYG